MDLPISLPGLPIDSGNCRSVRARRATAATAHLSSEANVTFVGLQPFQKFGEMPQAI